MIRSTGDPAEQAGSPANTTIRKEHAPRGLTPSLKLRRRHCDRALHGRKLPHYLHPMAMHRSYAASHKGLRNILGQFSLLAGRTATVSL